MGWLPESARLCAAPDWLRDRRFCRTFRTQTAWCHCATCERAPLNRAGWKTPGGQNDCLKSTLIIFVIITSNLKWSVAFISEAGSYLRALYALVRAVEHQTGAQQLRLGLRAAGFCAQASVGEHHVPPIIPVRILARRPLRVQGRAAPVNVEADRRRPWVYLHGGWAEALLHQRGPRWGPRRVAAPIIRAEGDGKRLTVVHHRGHGFLRINWRGKTDTILMKPLTWRVRGVFGAPCRDPGSHAMFS